MRAMVLTGFGGLEQLQPREVPIPEPGPGGVLVRVAAAAVNNTDLNTRTGWYGSGGWSGAVTIPRIQGADVCGRITAVGDGVPADRVGQRVVIEPVLRTMHGRPLDPSWYLGSECDGGFAEYVAVPSANAHPVHRGLSDIEWASFPCSYSTAEHLLARSRVGPADEVLVTGASGGVGSAVVQLAKARGAAVTAVCGAAKAEAVAALGAERTMDRDEPLGEQAFDVVVDLVGGPRWADYLAALRRRGRYATAGAIAGPHVELDLRTLYLHDLTLIGATVYDETVFPGLLRHIESGAVDPVVAMTFPLAEMRQAQEAFAQHRHVGKIVLTVAE
jgi:NADPH:quinone reductase-like Zn-dependent oxidoreductase